MHTTTNAGSHVSDQRRLGKVVHARASDATASSWPVIPSCASLHRAQPYLQPPSRIASHKPRRLAQLLNVSISLHVRANAKWTMDWLLPAKNVATKSSARSWRSCSAVLDRRVLLAFVKSRRDFLARRLKAGLGMMLCGGKWEVDLALRFLGLGAVTDWTMLVTERVCCISKLPTG